MKPLLSICIPTANRPRYIKKAIDSIVSQKSFVEGKVEVVVSDNSGINSDTRDVLKDYTKRYDSVRYYNNDKSSSTENYCRALRLGTGLYRKLINDTVYFDKYSLDDMVCLIETNQDERPVILWKIYHRIGKDYVSTSNFEEVMRTISYYSTWIAEYGIWEDEEEDILFDYNSNRDNYITRFMHYDDADLLAKKRESIGDITDDQFWHFRYLRKSFEHRGNAVIVDCASRWLGESPLKKYGKGVMKWCFYDYYLDILNEFKNEGYLSQECVDNLERDIGFSFFVNFMVDFEFPNSNIEYDSTDTFIQDILDEYRNKDYFDELYTYYRLKRQQRIEELNHN